MRTMIQNWPRCLTVCVTLLAISFSVLAAQETATAAKALTLNISVDRPDAIYQLGQVATFTIEAQEDAQPLNETAVTCVFSKDGWQPKQAETVSLKNGKATLTGKLDEPGFLLLRATIGKTTALAGAAYEPLQLKPSLPPPADFDQFWAKPKDALAEVPMTSKLIRVEPPSKGIEAFDVEVACVGKAVTGYLGKPENPKAKSLPAILFVHGAGVRSSNLSSTSWALKEGGMLALDINAHGLPNGQPDEFYKNLAEGELKTYRTAGNHDREECYFKGMFLRMIRAIDFLTSQPEWDGKTLIVYGTSQGGFQALAAAGLDARVTFICAGVPAGCDHTGSAANRISGWPKLAPVDSEGKPDPIAFEVARYFDCVNFAGRAKCQGAVVTVGYIDTTCPPTSVYAAFNNLPVPKAIHADVAAGHSNTPAASDFMKEAALRHVREMK